MAYGECSDAVSSNGVEFLASYRRCSVLINQSGRGGHGAVLGGGTRAASSQVNYYVNALELDDSIMVLVEEMKAWIVLENLEGGYVRIQGNDSSCQDCSDRGIADDLKLTLAGSDHVVLS